MSSWKRWVQLFAIGTIAAACVAFVVLSIRNSINKKKWEREAQVARQRETEENTQKQAQTQKEWMAVAGPSTLLADPLTHKLTSPLGKWVPVVLKYPKFWGKVCAQLKGAMVADGMDRSLPLATLVRLEEMSNYPDGISQQLSQAILALAGIKHQEQSIVKASPAQPLIGKTLACTFGSHTFSVEMPSKPESDDEGCDESPQNIVVITDNSKRLKSNSICTPDLQPLPRTSQDPKSVCQDTLAVPLGRSSIAIFFQSGQSPVGFIYDVDRSTVTPARFLAIASAKREFHGNSFSMLTQDLSSSIHLQVWMDFHYAGGKLTSTVDRERTWRNFPVKEIFLSQSSFEQVFKYHPGPRESIVSVEENGNYEENDYYFRYNDDAKACNTGYKFFTNLLPNLMGMKSIIKGCGLQSILLDLAILVIESVRACVNLGLFLQF